MPGTAGISLTSCARVQRLRPGRMILANACEVWIRVDAECEVYRGFLSRFEQVFECFVSVVQSSMDPRHLHPMVLAGSGRLESQASLPVFIFPVRIEGLPQCPKLFVHLVRTAAALQGFLSLHANRVGIIVLPQIRLRMLREPRIAAKLVENINRVVSSPDQE